MANIEKAIKIALEAHQGQVDKQGQPYILHPLRVMMMVETENEKIAAVLHDVVEDTNIDLQALHDSGLPMEALDAVVTLSRNDGESYKEFIIRCKEDEIARKVKIADLTDNSRIDRSLIHNVAKYHRAYKYLTGQWSEEEYLNG